MKNFITLIIFLPSLLTAWPAQAKLLNCLWSLQRIAYDHNEMVQSLRSAPFVKLETLQTTDQIFLQPIQNISGSNPEILVLAMQIKGYLGAPDSSKSDANLVKILSKHLTIQKVDHKIKRPLLDRPYILITPSTAGNFANRLALLTKDTAGMDVVLKPRALRFGNAAIYRKLDIKNGQRRLSGYLQLPLESVIEPNALSPALFHELVHLKNAVRESDNGDVMTGSLEHLVSGASYASNVAPPPVGIGVKNQLIYQSPYRFNFSIDEIEAHLRQAHSYLKMGYAPPTFIIYQGLILAAQIKYLLDLVGPVGLKPTVDSSSGNATFHFDFGPPFGLLVLTTHNQQFQQILSQVTEAQKQFLILLNQNDPHTYANLQYFNFQYKH